MIPQGMKSKTGLTLAVVPLLILFGFDVTETEVSNLIDVVLALSSVIGTILAKYGIDDKQVRLEKALESSDRINPKSKDLIELAEKALKQIKESPSK